ncbi:MAG: AAA family ATPase [Elusimicrobia bacterium]|nr:AAA family ATPase [Elusimicrobiota bacterium]
MKRLIETNLIEWKNSKQRKPLIVRGARQVGKTHSIKEFGQRFFKSFVNLDLEKRRDLHGLFSGDLTAARLLSQLELALEHRIVPGETLLFLDEIQTCPRAIMALRYLYEERPGLHVVAAGSLLEFALSEISFPVGRVQFFEMQPMTFAEYLQALGKERAAIEVLSPPKALPAPLHALLLDDLRNYFLVGGMPASVRAFAETGSVRQALEVQADLCETFRQDFPKYAPRADADCLEAVWEGAARGLGGQVLYTRLAEGHAHTTNHRAFDLLRKARLLTKVLAANPSSLPLGASASTRRFKTLLVDIGMWRHLCGGGIEHELRRGDLLDVRRGAAAEQFVGQELRAAQGSDPYYWSRESRGSTAEVDFLSVAGGKVYGVEVKSGASGRLRSLHMLLASYPAMAGGRVLSTQPYAELPEQKLSFLPLYYAYSSARNNAGFGLASNVHGEVD